MNKANTAAARIAAAAATVLLSVLSPLSLAQGADDLYEVSVKMEIPGMPMAMPATTQRSCVKKGGSDADIVPHQDNCRVSDARRSGSRMTFTVTCTAPNAMTGNGDFTFAADGYNGQIRFKGKMDGRDMEMTQTIAGRRVGACTAR